MRQQPKVRGGAGRWRLTVSLEPETAAAVERLASERHASRALVLADLIRDGLAVRAREDGREAR